MSINVYPFLAALLFSWALFAAVIALPWRWAATSIIGVYLLLALIMEVFVPPATGWLVVAEHLAFRRDNPNISLVAFEWPLTPVLVAIGIDIYGLLIFLFMQRGKKKASPQEQTVGA